MDGNKCENCGCGEYKEVSETYFEVINPNGEFVKGYCGVVSVQKNKNYYAVPNVWAR